MRVFPGVLGLVLVAAGALHAQRSPLRLDAFAFEGGVAIYRDAHAAPRLAADASVRLAGHGPLDIIAASTIAELSEHAGHRQDLSLSVVRTWPVRTRAIALGVGIAAHRLRTRIDGAATSPELAALENERSGLRAGVAGLARVALPLAPAAAAAFELTARGALVPDASQLALAAGIRLAPRSLRLGEPAVARIAQPARGAWDELVGQVMLMEDAALGDDVMATRSGLVLRLGSRPDTSMAAAVARVARVLAASSEAVTLEITAPAPADLALAATAAGFPPERIRLGEARGPVTVRAIRSAAARSNPSARP